MFTLERIKNDSDLIVQAAKSVTPELLGSIIDHTVLNPAATRADIAKMCREANEIGSFVCVYGSRVADVRNFINRLGLKSIRGIAAVAGFPAGAQMTEAKVAESHVLIMAGADEVDIVLNVGKLRDGDYGFVKDDIKEVASVLKKAQGQNLRNLILKVIQENCLLTDEEKRIAVRITAEVCEETGLHMFAKTSTGFGKPKDAYTPVGATVDDIWLMHEEIRKFLEKSARRGSFELLGAPIGIKAAGGVKDARTALRMMLAAGCFNDDLTLKENLSDIFRIGASAGKQIVEDFRKNFMS